MTRERGARRPAAYTVVTPANHYPSRLPAFGDESIVKLVTPRYPGARIGQYLALLSPGGGTRHPVDTGRETFFYALEGGAFLLPSGGDEVPMSTGSWAFLPATTPWELEAGDEAARVLFLSRPREPHEGVRAPGACSGHRDDEPFADTAIPGLTRRELLPVHDPAWDFAMSLLRFGPGVGLPNVEIHDEEHGLYMTEGAGVYTLGDEYHQVEADDFIYMAPYCPQTFRASGAGPAEYLLYKDTWRDGFDWT
jgi:(S)-ureidoglycine aminohydrolase